MPEDKSPRYIWVKQRRRRLHLNKDGVPSCGIQYRLSEIEITDHPVGFGPEDMCKRCFPNLDRQ